MATISNWGYVRSLMLTLLLVVAVFLGSLAVTDRTPAQELPPRYEAMVVPIGMPALPISGVTRHYGTNGEVHLFVGDVEITVYGMPVLVLPSVGTEAGEIVLPSKLEAGFSSADLTAEASLLASNR